MKSSVEGALAKAHEPQAKNEAMDEFDKKRAEIFTANNTTEAAYQQELYVVSSDPATREVFERLMKELAADRKSTRLNSSHT